MALVQTIRKVKSGGFVVGMPDSGLRGGVFRDREEEDVTGSSRERLKGKWPRDQPSAGWVVPQVLICWKSVLKLYTQLWKLGGALSKVGENRKNSIYVNREIECKPYVIVFAKHFREDEIHNVGVEKELEIIKSNNNKEILHVLKWALQYIDNWEEKKETGSYATIWV